MKRLSLVALLAMIAACSDSVIEPAAVEEAPQFAALENGMQPTALGEGSVALYSAEILTTADSKEMGRTIYFVDRGNKRTGIHFVPDDPRRAWNPVGGITYALDGADGATASGLSSDETGAAIDAAMDTWQGVRCSNLPLIGIGTAPFDIGYVQDFFGFGGIPEAVFADVTHGGFLPGPFFDLLRPDGSTFILGVTFTLIWVDSETEIPTDLDGNGQLDAAFREVYYNDAFPWNVGSTYDVETVALHEAGHALSQGHFGTAFETGRNGKLHFAPRAVMNASYSGIQHQIRGSDNAGHCTNWAQWRSDVF